MAPPSSRYNTIQILVPAESSECFAVKKEREDYISLSSTEEEILLLDWLVNVLSKYVEKKIERLDVPYSYGESLTVQTIDISKIFYEDRRY